MPTTAPLLWVPQHVEGVSLCAWGVGGCIYTVQSHLPSYVPSPTTSRHQSPAFLLLQQTACMGHTVMMLTLISTHCSTHNYQALLMYL